MKLVVGLGNPGEEYKDTRHNTGFMLVDELAKQKKIDWDKSKTDLLEHCWFLNSTGKVELIKPQTFMNESGKAVLYSKKKHNINLDKIYVVYDDLDIKLGKYKIQKGRGPKDHNGLNNIYQKLKSEDFWHIRIGIDNRPLDNKPMGIEFVLQNFTDEERKIIDGVIGQVIKDLMSKIMA